MLVEESLNLRSVLKEYFKMMNYEVVDFGDGESAIKYYQKRGGDICLLDICLPKKDGYAVINALHNISPDLPVIFVTAKDGKEDRIKGFKSGCEDYVTKPFSTEELQFRMEAVLKRCEREHKKGTLNKEGIYHLGNLIFNYSEMKLLKGNQVYLLTRKEAQLLKILYEYKNKLVPREIITKEIWGDSKAATGRSLDVFVSKVRKLLKSDEDDVPENLNPKGGRRNRYKPRLEPKVEIINVHGAGYSLIIRD